MTDDGSHRPSSVFRPPSSALPPRRFHPLKTAWVLLVLLAFFLYTTHRDRPPRLWTWRGEIFGSTYGVQVARAGLGSADVEELRAGIEALLARLDAALSTWKPDSDLSRFNASASTEPIAVSTDLVEVTRLALEISRLSGGAFDCTYRPLFALWGFGEEKTGAVPGEAEIADVRARCGWTNLAVAGPDLLRKARPDVEFNLNAIAPGFAAQRIAELLSARGITNFYVDVGGEEVVRGEKGPGQPWRLGIEKPRHDAEPGEALSAIVRMTDGALATSGDYRNYFRGADGTFYSHIFDPRIGRPATSRVASVSVIHTNGAWADALATTLFVLGPDVGLAWLTNVPGAEAYFLVRDGTAFREVSSTGFVRHLADR